MTAWHLSLTVIFYHLYSLDWSLDEGLSILLFSFCFLIHSSRSSSVMASILFLTFSATASANLLKSIGMYITSTNRTKKHLIKFEESLVDFEDIVILVVDEVSDYLIEDIAFRKRVSDGCK